MTRPALTLIMGREQANMPFGDALERIRKERGLTQAQLAQKLDVNQSLIAKWESGKVQPRAATLAKLAETLEVAVEELIVGEAQTTSSSAPTKSLRALDPKLVELFEEAHKLSPGDREALRRILEAMLTRTRIQEAMAG